MMNVLKTSLYPEAPKMMPSIIWLMLHGLISNVAASVAPAIITTVPPITMIPSTDSTDASTSSDSMTEDVTSDLHLDITSLETEVPLNKTITELETKSIVSESPLQTSTDFETTTPQIAIELGTMSVASNSSWQTFAQFETTASQSTVELEPKLVGLDSSLQTSTPFETKTTQSTIELETKSYVSKSSLETSTQFETTISESTIRGAVEDTTIPTTTDIPLETTSSPASIRTSTQSTTHQPTLPPNLQILPLVLFNASSSSSHSQPHSSLSYNHPPSPQLHHPENNNVLVNILHLNTDFSFPATQRPSASFSLHEESSSSSSSMSISSSLEPISDVRLRVTNAPDSIVNLTGEVGGSAFLPCTTHHSMERQVSWVRRRDWHILTSGTVAYTKEERFTVHHPEGSTDWTLVIKYLERADAGTYECQVSTGNGIMSRLVELDVVEPKAVIPGNGEYYIDVGSTITLDCFIQQSLVAPEYIFWYHNSRMINYDKERGGVSVQVDIGQQVEHVRSRLTVTRATPRDSGNYTCAAANSKPAYTTVYITNGNKIAAIQPRAMAEGVKLQCCKLLFTLGVFVSVVNSFSFLKLSLSFVP